MTAHTAAILPPPREPLPRHWIVAGIVIVLAHAGLFYWMIHERFFAAAPGAPPAAIMIDLAPMPEEPPMELPAEVPPEVVEPEPEPEPEEAVIVPEPPPRVPKAVAILEMRPKPVPKKVAKPQAKPAEKPTRTASAAAGAPTSGASMTNGASNASWHAMVSAHLQRHKPGGGQEKGVCTVAFSVDRSGHVSGARLSSSSGSATLDRLAVSAVLGASPVPAPPADVAGSRFPFNVPIRFR
jgi:protein TonB